MPIRSKDLAVYADFFRWESVPWLRLAACRGPHGPAEWFPDGPKTVNQDFLVKQAKLICNTCPVQFRCLARYIDQPCGVFGGFDVKEREKIWNSMFRGYRRSPEHLRKYVEDQRVEVRTSQAV